jgi:hypothetical protein
MGTMKICTKCKKEKNIKEFCKDKRLISGLRSCCRECDKKYRLENREYISKRHSDHYFNNKFYYDAYHKIYRTTLKRKVAQEKYKLKFPEKIKAKSDLNNAIVAGKLNRLPCRICGGRKTEGHHSDYSKPLYVTWLCHKHHKELHKSLRGM